jgi:DNA-binding MarR family transcriptional regulator
MAASNGINLILQQKPTMALRTIAREGNTYASLISREIKSTFAHTANILTKLEDHGLVRFESSGSDNRVKRVELTHKGEAVAVLIDELVSVFEKKNVSRKKKSTDKKMITDEKRQGDSPSKLEMIKAQIELISKQELDGKKSILQEDFVRIGQRLGPYRRELRKIMETGKKDDAKKAKKVDEMIVNIFTMREKLREIE